MKILVLGGCGYIGSSTARDLVKAEQVKLVTLADINPDLKRVHESLLRNSKVSAKYIDITGPSSKLIKLIRSHDLVVNCVGPYSLFGLSAPEAAIEAGVNYADVCDDLEITRKIFGLDRAARRAGVCLCTGLGSVPGISNMLAAYGAARIASVSDIDVQFVIALMDPIGKAGLTLAIGQFNGEVWQYLDGRLVSVPAGTGQQPAKFAAPFGEIPVYYARHPEPFTFPRRFRGVRNVTNKASFFPISTVDLFREILRLGLFDSREIAAGNTSVSPRDFIVSFVKAHPELRYTPGLKASLGCNVVLKGRIGDSAATVTYRCAGWGGPLTAIPTSIGAQLLAGGAVKVKGVVAPEAAFNPEVFLNRLANRGIKASEEITLARPVTAITKPGE
jgi:saccharopine dehydrogenase-like NADP-dependent oxidoreductase